MTYAILSANTITAHGPASVLWPDTSFASGGPNARFLIDAGAVAIRADAAYDPATETLQPCEPYVFNGKVFSTIAAPIIPPAPIPDWATFRGGLLISPEVAALMGAARESGCEPAVTALPVALEKAQTGGVGDFAACWALVARDGAASPELIAQLVATAEACNLPEAFVAALQPPTP
jgi:hypothetical protein